MLQKWKKTSDIWTSIPAKHLYHQASESSGKFY